MQSQDSHVRHRTYLNVMEVFVTNEVERQLEKLPIRVQRYIQVEAVVVSALNQLPPLYISSHAKGWQYQYHRSKRRLQSQVTDAVQQALIAVRYTVFDELSTLEKMNYLDGWVEAIPGSHNHDAVIPLSKAH